MWKAQDYTAASAAGYKLIIKSSIPTEGNLQQTEALQTSCINNSPSCFLNFI